MRQAQGLVDFGFQIASEQIVMQVPAEHKTSRHR
jgi:hypothetical protein